MNELDFNRDVRLDENGNIKTVTVEQTGTAEKCISRLDFFNRIQLDENNNLKIVLE